MRRYSNVLLFVMCLAILPDSGNAQNRESAARRVEGMLIGSLIGDAAGAPTEFAAPVRTAWTDPDSVMSQTTRAGLAAAFRFRTSTRGIEPFGPWTADGPPGTLTDDSRFKILFFRSLASHGTVDQASFARSLLEWYDDTSGAHGSLPAEWLTEFAFGARWVLGARDGLMARPPERAWGGIPTMAGQMPFLPVAALHVGDPVAAYRTTWDVNFFDNGVGRDHTAALVAGIAAVLDGPADWRRLAGAMRETDPFGYADVPWVERNVDRWLDAATRIANEAEGRPARLFELLEAELGAETWWEAWVPLTVVVSCAELTGGDPLATMQLILEFGHDTDSYLQVAGALFGALHGPEVFPEEMRLAVKRQLRAEYGVEFGEWLALIDQHGSP